MNALSQVYFLQFSGRGGEFSVNLEGVLEYAREAASKGGRLLVVGPLALEGGRLRDYEKYAAVSGKLARARDDLLEAEVLPVLLLEAQGGWALFEGQSEYAARGGVIQIGGLRVGVDSRLSSDLNVVPEFAFFDRFKTPETPVASSSLQARLSALGVDEERLFLGGSTLCEPSGRVYRAPYFKNALFSAADLGQAPQEPAKEAVLFEALQIMIRAYASQGGLKKAILGLSGGVDSALVAALLALSLPKESIETYSLSTSHNEPQGIADAKALASSLGVFHQELKMDGLVGDALSAVSGFDRQDADEAHTRLMKQNIQARLRAILLMSRANLCDGIVFGTSNKTELVAGFGTLYGDLVGGFNPLKDLHKHEVYALLRYLDETYALGVPRGIFERAPSAELEAGLKDEDVLPKYDEMIAFSKLHLEAHQSIQDAAEAVGWSLAKAEAFVARIRSNEFKRRQGVPGFISSESGFCKEGWDYPLMFDPRVVK